MVGAWAGRLLVVAALAAVVFLDPFTSAERQRDDAAITRYEASMQLSEDGTLVTEERISVHMPAGKRGIFRIFDTEAPRRPGVHHPVSDVGVARDGQPEPSVWVDSARGTETLRIGDVRVYLDPGEHHYVIRSTTENALEPGDDGETVWWWDVIGEGWQMTMASATVHVELPIEPIRVECVVGEDGPCDVTADGTTVSVTTGPLDRFTPVTMRVAFPEGALPPPPAGHSEAANVVFTLVAVAVAAALGLLLLARTREKAPGFPVLFEPPPGIGPALGTKVLHEQPSPHELQATLYSMADRGLLRLEGDDTRWHVELVADPSAVPHDAVDAAVLDSLRLRTPGDRFTVSRTKTSGERVAAARKALRKQVERDAKPYLHPSAAGSAAIVLGWLSAGAVLLIAGFHLFGDSGFRPWPLLFGLGAFALIAMGMMFDPGVSTKRTTAGRDLWSRMGGFERFLTTESSESRFEAAKHLDWYPRYLPWALALGSADAWARRFEEQGVATPPVPWLMWNGRQHFDSDRMASSFNSAITAASAAYAASQSSSSGGGGGFSGGSGGGGGGGGSW